MKQELAHGVSAENARPGADGAERAVTRGCCQRHKNQPFFLSINTHLKAAKVSVGCGTVRLPWKSSGAGFYDFACFVSEMICRLFSGLLFSHIRQKTAAGLLGAGDLPYTKYLLGLPTCGAASESSLAFS